MTSRRSPTRSAAWPTAHRRGPSSVESPAPALTSKSIPFQPVVALSTSSRARLLVSFALESTVDTATGDDDGSTTHSVSHSGDVGARAAYDARTGNQCLDISHRGCEREWADLFPCPECQVVRSGMLPRRIEAEVASPAKPEAGACAVIRSLR